MTISKALEVARKYYGLNQENYWLYVNRDTGEVKFTNDYEKQAFCIGYFVEDDGRINSIIRIAQSRIKKRLS